MSFCNLINGISPNIWRVCFVLLNSVLLNLLCVWIWACSGALAVIFVWDFIYFLWLFGLQYSYFSRMSSSGYLALSWVDPRLAFQARDVQNIKIDSSKIWTPDIELYNAWEFSLSVRTLCLFSAHAVYLFRFVQCLCFWSHSASLFVRT